MGPLHILNYRSFFSLSHLSKFGSSPGLLQLVGFSYSPEAAAKCDIVWSITPVVTAESRQCALKFWPLHQFCITGEDCCRGLQPCPSFQRKDIPNHFLSLDPTLSKILQLLQTYVCRDFTNFLERNQSAMGS